MENENLNKKSDIKNRISYSIGIFLLISGFLQFINSVIWAIVDTASDKWFERIALSLICFGFAGIILKQKK